MSGRPIQNPPQGTVPPRGATRVADAPWCLTFVSTGGPVPCRLKVKKLLKYAAWCGLKCRSAIEQTEETCKPAKPNSTN
jgi:hypothetical protein